MPVVTDLLADAAPMVDASASRGAGIDASASRGASADASARSRQVEPYDFRRPTTLAREHSRALELAFETFARQWGVQLTAKVRVLSQVTSDGVTLLTYDEYAAGLDALTAMVLVRMGGAGGKAIVQFPLGAALGWVSHMLGANRPQPVDDRVFTPIEEALMRRLVGDALDDLRYSFGDLLPATMAVTGFQYNSQFAQAAGKGDLMVVAAFEVRVGERTTHATMAVPAEVILPQFGESAPAVSVARSRELLDAQLADVPVGVALRFAAAPVLPADVLGLAVGDLVHLPHPQRRPLTITVDDEPIGTAAVGANGSRLAGVVVTASTTAS